MRVGDFQCYHFHMNVLRFINDIVMFLVELGMLALLGFGGYGMFDLPELWRWVIALGLIGGAIWIWSDWLAPKAKTRLQQPRLAAAKMGMFIVAAFVGLTWDHAFAAVFIAIATISVAIEYQFGSNADRYTMG